MHFFFILDVIIPPRAVNVSANTVAVFTCTAVADTFNWQANGLQIDEVEGEIFITNTCIELDLTLNIRESTLELTVSSTDNATNITCTAISISPLAINKSVPVLLLVQGTYMYY